MDLFRRWLRQLKVPLLALALTACAVPAAPAPTAPPGVSPTIPEAPPPIATPPTATLPTAAPATAIAPVAGPPTVAPPSPTLPPPTFPPAPPGGYLVYPRPDGSLQRTDATAPVQIAPASEPGVVLPWAASPDGRTIAFVSGTGIWSPRSGSGANPPSLALYFVGVDGANPRKVQDLLPPRTIDLTPGGDDAFNLLPALTSLQDLAWSPDGSRVAFVSAHETQVDVYTATLDGRMTRLTSTPDLEQGPRWSPDGTLLAVRTTRGFGTGAGWDGAGLTIVPRDGGPPARVVDAFSMEGGASATVMIDLIWVAPAIVVAHVANPTAGGAEVHALATGDGAITRVAATPQGPFRAIGWSDGPQALAVVDPAPPGLLIWRPGEPNATRISDEPITTMAWSPQGDALAYSADAGARRPGITIWSIGTDGDFRRVSETPAQRLAWSSDGQQLAADATVYDRAGRAAVNLPGMDVLPIGWSRSGLFFYSRERREEQSDQIWLWDGTETRRLDERLNRSHRAGVVGSP